jgi:hypothetical protein
MLRRELELSIRYMFETRLHRDLIIRVFVIPGMKF